MRSFNTHARSKNDMVAADLSKKKYFCECCNLKFSFPSKYKRHLEGKKLYSSSLVGDATSAEDNAYFDETAPLPEQLPTNCFLVT